MSIKGIFPIDDWNFNSHSIFTDLPDKEANLLTANMSAHHCKKGEIVFREGTSPSGIYYIRQGKIKKYKVDRDGREQIIYIANTGELIGYHAILSESRYPDSAAAIEESELSYIPKEDFIAALNTSSILKTRLLKLLSHEFSVLVNNVSMFAQRTVRERLALQLILLREKYKVNFKEGMPVEINMGRDDLASLAGTARENVVRVLSEFKSDGILETRGRKIIVLDVTKLVKIANY